MMQIIPLSPLSSGPHLAGEERALSRMAAGGGWSRSGGGAGPIANGNRGWLVSSVTGRERECGREIVNVLDEWCDKLEACKAQGEGEGGGEAATGEGASVGKAKGGSSIDALLANEVAALKKQPRFVSVESGCKALLFVRIREDARKGGKGEHDEKGEKGGKQLEEGEEKEVEGEKEEAGKKVEGGKEEQKGEGEKEAKEGDKGGEKEQEKEQEEGVTGGGEKVPEKEGQGGEGEKGEAGGEQGRVSPCELAEAVLRHAKATQQSATRGNHVARLPEGTTLQSHSDSSLALVYLDSNSPTSAGCCQWKPCLKPPRRSNPALQDHSASPPFSPVLPFTYQSSPPPAVSGSHVSCLPGGATLQSHPLRILSLLPCPPLNFPASSSVCSK
ncbi:unnamed protein product [Closterium sp. Naga37s-1]|nr:unnamed protein product [Closterium sp. Naga37s-1]